MDIVKIQQYKSSFDEIAKEIKDDEAIAINCHMGFSRGNDSSISIGESFRFSPLAWLIHVADEAATFLLDRGSPEA